MPAREYFSRVSPKGQITLPAEVRKELNIRPKDSVAIELDKGVTRIKRKPKLQDFYQVTPLHVLRRVGKRSSVLLTRIMRNMRLRRVCHSGRVPGH